VPVESVRDPLDQPLAGLIRRPPVTCAADATVRTALARMREERVGSIVVVDTGNMPLGIFTLRDLRDRVMLEAVSLDAAIAQVMTPDPVTLPDSALAFEAALLMARRGIHHMVVTRAGKAAGVLSETDLFTLQRVGVTQVSEAIRGAPERARLEAAAADIRLLAGNLLAQGVAAEQLTRIVSTLNDLLTARLVELELAPVGIAPEELCWLALGSEGRHEQTFATDQDNGIIFPDPIDSDVNRVRARLLPVAQRINEGLAACGFPLCKGGIMASNPRYCLSLAEWKQTFGGWMSQADSQALLNATIFFDFRPLFGAAQLARELRGWLAHAASSQPLFLRLMAENALRNAPPLGLIRDFAVAEHEGRPGTLDLKLNGSLPFVDGARILSLAAGDSHTNTAERLRAAAAARHVPSAEVEAWVEAFHFIQMLRLRNQQQRAAAGLRPDNLLAPDALNELDRRILKEAFRQARRLQERLRLDYQL
jgi:CBS domain-containing protein